MPKFGIARLYSSDLLHFINLLVKNRIDAYEIGFDKRISPDIINNISHASRINNIKLSCHLPLWINLGNYQKENNIGYLVRGLKLVEELKSTGVFHLGFYGRKKFNELKDNIICTIKDALTLSDVKNAKLGIETTGKQTTIGTCEEIIELTNSIDDKRVIPIIDWSHLYARNNGTSPYIIEDFKKILEKFENEIGYKPYHFHGGGIKYKMGNEVKHLSAKTNEPPIPNLFTALQDLGYEDFTLIVESPDSIEDVKWLKQVWLSPKDHLEGISIKKSTTLLDFI